MTDTVNKQRDALVAAEQALRIFHKYETKPANLMEVYAQIDEALATPSTPVQGYQDGDLFNRLVEAQYALKQIIGDMTPAEFVIEVVKNQEEFRRTQDELQKAHSELQGYREALEEIRAMTAWAKDEHRQDLSRQVYEEANQALSQSPNSAKASRETLNQDRYDFARKIVEGLNIWIDNKLILLSVIDRALKLEREVEALSQTDIQPSGADKVREMFEAYAEHGDFTVTNAIEETLHALGITIPGINSTEDDQPGPSIEQDDEIVRMMAPGVSILVEPSTEEEETDA